MRTTWAHFVPVAGLALLGACASPDEAIVERQRHTLFANGEAYWVTSRFDPFRLAWTSDLVPAQGLRAAITRADAERLVEAELGPILCEGAPMAVAGEPTPYATRGGWQITAHCA